MRDMSKNKMVIFRDYAEIVICDILGKESGRVKISLEDIGAVEAYRWSYSLQFGVSSTIDGKHIGINRYIANARDDEMVFWLNGNRFDCRRGNLEIRKLIGNHQK